MISVEDAVQKIIESVKEDNRVGEVIDIKDAYGRVSFDDVYSSYALPPFRASTRDGYAVVASDGKGKRKVLCGVKAGEAEAVSYNNRYVLMKRKVKVIKENFLERSIYSCSWNLCTYKHWSACS